MPLDPYFSAGKLSWLLEHDRQVAEAVCAGRRTKGDRPFRDGRTEAR